VRSENPGVGPWNDKPERTPSNSHQTLRQLRAKAAIAVGTIRTCDNWPAVLAGYGAARLPARATATDKDLRFVFRDGTRLTCPRRPMVSWPVFEVLIGDAYRLEQAGAQFDRPTHIIDVGAHVGSASLALSRIWPGVPITCVEPSRTSASLLRRNLAANRIPATVVQAAAGAHAGTAVLQEAESGSGGNSIDWQADAGDLSDSNWLVPVVPMADLLAQAGTGPVMVKLDCEGSEFEIVGGTPAAAWDQVTVVLMEHHPVPDQDFTELVERFRQLGFGVAWHDPGDRPGMGMACFVRQPQAAA
jgi:FkbM family methyltransferase